MNYGAGLTYQKHHGAGRARRRASGAGLTYRKAFGAGAVLPMTPEGELDIGTTVAAVASVAVGLLAQYFVIKWAIRGARGK